MSDNKIIYNGVEYSSPVINNTGVGEFVSNNGQKNPDGSNNERFNDYRETGGNQINGTAEYSTVLGSGNSLINGKYTVVGGYTNTIAGSTVEGNTVLGMNNNVTAPTVKNNFVSADTVRAQGTTIQNNALFGGNYTAQGDSIVDNIVGGQEHRLTGIITGNVISGHANIVQGTVSDNIINGYTNNITNVRYSIIGGSQHQQIANVDGSIIVGNNHIVTGSGTSYSYYNAVFGYGHTVTPAPTDYKAGFSPSTLNGSYGIIGGFSNKNYGQYNLITGYNLVVYGMYNIATGYGTGGFSGDILSAFNKQDRTDFVNNYLDNRLATSARSGVGVLEGSYCNMFGECNDILSVENGSDAYAITVNGTDNTASGRYGYIEGRYNCGVGQAYHIEGFNNILAGIKGTISSYASSVDFKQYATFGNSSSNYTHVEGNSNIVLNTTESHIEGYSNVVIKTGQSHIEGYANRCIDPSSSGPVTAALNHIEGMGNLAIGDIRAHIEGEYNYLYSSQGIHASGAEHIIYSSNYAYTEGYLGQILSSEKAHLEGNGRITYISGTENYTLSLQNGSLADVNAAAARISGYPVETPDITDDYMSSILDSQGAHLEGYLGYIGNSTYGHLEGMSILESDSSTETNNLYRQTLLASPGAHVEGGGNYINNGSSYAHAEGSKNMIDSSTSAHIEGESNKALNATTSHVEGSNNTIQGATYSHAEGASNTIRYSALRAHTEGNENIIENGSMNGHTEGYKNTISNGSNHVHIEGSNNTVTDGGNNVHIEGQNNISNQGAQGAHIEGQNNAAGSNSKIAHIEGYYNSINASDYAHAEGGYNNITQGSTYSHIEGSNNIIQYGTENSHVEGGYNNLSTGSYSHIEGSYNEINSSNNSHAEGTRNTITDGSSYGHIEGSYNKIGACSFTDISEGEKTIAYRSSYNAHSEGNYTQGGGDASHTQNLGTITNAEAQTALGMYNIKDTSATATNRKGNIAVIVGNGTTEDNKTPAYDNTATYAIDDEVTYNGKIYKCITAITTAEDFDVEKWEVQDIELINNQIIHRSNAATLSWDGYLDVSGGFSVNGTPIGGTPGDIANPNISDEYSNSTTYNIGDYCIYHNTLYKCNTAIAVAEDFDSTKWTATTVSTELLSVINRISALETALNGYSFANAMSQADYDDILVKDEDTIYPIIEE